VSRHSRESGNLIVLSILKNVDVGLNIKIGYQLKPEISTLVYDFI